MPSRTKKRRAPRFWFDAIGMALAVVGTGLAFLTLFSTGNWVQTALAIGLASIALFSCIGIFFAMRGSTRHEVEAKRPIAWSLSMNEIADASFHLAQLSDGDQAGDSRARAREACAAFEKAFTAVTGSPCRTTVKEVYVEAADPDGGARVRTLIAPTRHAHEDVAGAVVADNTDFAAILLQGQDYFFNNDLVDELRRGYRNSHWPDDKLVEWDRTGKYPYVSAVVWPIRVRHGGSGTPERWETRGFLCIDSQEAGVFSEQYDVAVGEIFANALMSAWQFITTKETGA